MKSNAPTSKDLAGLWKEHKEQGSAEAKNKIIVHYLGLVRIIAGRMAMNSPPQVEKDDLIGWGVLGLLDAVDKFDPGQRASFETYASTRIRGAIIDQIRSLDWAPRSLRRKARQMSQASAKLKEKLGREPTEGELAGEMGMTDTELFELTTEIHGAYILSLDARMFEHAETGETTLGHITINTAGLSPEESAEKKEMEQSLVEAIEKLSINEQHVITLYYYDELTLKEIGEVLGLSESRICQIHRAVIRKLKQSLKLSSQDATH
ncbi:MAG: FliA/WhiG family RNA polymerase sigma factor [Candidatus Abyssubacteria bacterium]|nr:FliA/WhiG family RNA polymerase sigma factor [Candidatus Abyssubacteria bacterium]